MNKIDLAQNIIIALDFPDQNSALALVDHLGEKINFYKIGLELLSSGQYFSIIDALARRGKRIFADLKFYDVPQTVHNALKSLSQYPIEFCTVHGHQEILEAAVQASQNIGILGVTVLTCLDQADLKSLGIDANVESLVKQRAHNAKVAGCVGVIASAQEAKLIKNYEPDLQIITPGIRLAEDQKHDQKRITTPKQAIQNGSDYLVIGRSVTQSKDPVQQLEKIISQVIQ